MNMRELSLWLGSNWKALDLTFEESLPVYRDFQGTKVLSGDS